MAIAALRLLPRCCDSELSRASQEAHQYAEENGILHMETSAKSATNVKNLFQEIGERAVLTSARRNAKTS